MLNMSTVGGRQMIRATSFETFQPEISVNEPIDSPLKYASLARDLTC